MRVLRFPCPVYKFRVSLRDFRLEIWRRILLRSDVSLARFHKVLQALLGWYAYTSSKSVTRSMLRLLKRRMTIGEESRCELSFRL